MIYRYTYERLTGLIGNMAMRSAMTRGVGAIFAIGVAEAATKTAESIAKIVEMSRYVKDSSTVAAQIQDTSKREKALLKITETQSKMALWLCVKEKVLLVKVWRMKQHNLL